jgi:hypothetical protein
MNSVIASILRRDRVFGIDSGTSRAESWSGIAVENA